MSVETTNKALTSLEIMMLQRQMRGDVLVAGTHGYETTRRLVNMRFDHTPALIARCLTSNDVVQAVRFARDADLEITIRSGGHSVAGHSVGDGVMMIDLSAMRQIDIDPIKHIACVQPGANNGELVVAAQAYGLATTTGTCATVGMGGSTLGGGIGWLMGRFGMTIDNVLAFELVTAEGDLITVDAKNHPDLFWALRGGGGNFGVVTAITYQLHPLSTVYGGMVIVPLAAAAPALQTYRDLTSNAPDELLAHAVFATIPDFGPALIIQAVYSGEDLGAGKRLLQPLRDLQPAVDLLGPRSYAETYMMLTPPLIPGAAWYDTGYSLHKPSDLALEQLITCALERPSPFSLISVHHVHGVATRVAANSTAFALRESHYAISHIGMWIDGDGTPETAWVKHTKAMMEPYASDGLYVGFQGDDGDAATRASYRENYDRLAAVKAQYDPENIFHRNHNIRPMN